MHLTSLKQPSVSSSEATKGGSSKGPIGSKTGHLKRKKDSSSAMDSNPSQTSASTPVLSSGKSAFNLNKPIFSAFFIIHSESASGYDASVDSTAEADPGLFAPNDSIPQQQGMDEGTKNTSFDHISAGTDPHVLADQTQSVSERLETILTQPITGNGASSIARQVEEEEASRTIKLEDLAKLVSYVQPSFKDLDSPEDDLIIVVDDSDEDEEADKNEVHTTTNAEIEDASVPKSSSPKSSQIQELTNQFNELTEEVKGLKKQAHELEIELLGDLKEIPSKLEDFTKIVTSLTSQVAELKILHLLNKVTDALNQFTQAIASQKTKDGSIPSVGQAGTQPAKGEKNTNQATIS
ncbi:hypothetical protein Tco_1327734 [Tanacetum coccineum]